MRANDLTAELWTLALPLPRSYAVKGMTLSLSHVLITRLADAGGREGWGYSWFNFSDQCDAVVTEARALLAEAGASLDAMLQIERIDERRAASTKVHPLSKDAASAWSMAAWDLVGQRTGKSCSELWGGLAHRSTHECYATALFADRTADELVEDARAFRAQNFRVTKFVPVPSIPDTIERLRRIRDIFPEPHTIAIDFSLRWTSERITELVKNSPVDFAWLEDPVPFANLIELTTTLSTQIAVGETCTEQKPLLDLHAESKVPAVIIDMQHVGGPVRFLESARALAAMGARIGSHAFTHHSTHLLSCVPDSLPVENLDWWDCLYSPALTLDPWGRISVAGPGFGVGIRQEMIARHGRPVT